MPPAARVGDLHVCPMVTGVVPHVGGPILPPCAPTVITGYMPQARMGDMATCVGPPDVIVKGSPTVLVSNMMAARIGDMTAHGGIITLGCMTVLIGEAGGGGGGGGGAGGMVAQAGVAGPTNDPSAQAKALTAAAKGGMPFTQPCNA